MKKNENINVFIEDETGLAKASLNLVLENGDALLREIEKAQQLTAELNETFKRITRFKPKYRQG